MIGASFSPSSASSSSRLSTSSFPFPISERSSIRLLTWLSAPNALSRALFISVDVATTGFTDNPVISCISSIARIFRGSTMATVSLFPTLLIGIS